MEGVERRRWCLKEGPVGERERLDAPFPRFVKQTHKETWFSEASLETVKRMCLETGVYWRYSL